MAAGDELIGRRQRGFGLARPHLRFHDVESRLPHLIERGGLQGTRRVTGWKQSGECLAGLETDRFPAQRSQSGGGFGLCLLTLSALWREAVLIRANPVR